MNKGCGGYMSLYLGKNLAFLLFGTFFNILAYRPKVFN